MDARRACAWVAGALLGALFAAVAPPSAVAGKAAEPSLQPPTAAEFREATANFLAAHPPPRNAGAAPLEAGPSSTGGIEPDGGGNGNGNGPGNGIAKGITAAPFPEHRIVAFYGAPQLTATIVGRKSPRRATAKLRRQARGYTGSGRRPVVRAFNLVAVIATASPGRDRLYRSRQPDAVIRTYLKQARKLGGRLVLDIQPARAGLMDEVKALGPWLAKPDVDLVIDAEWLVGRNGIPGRDLGSIRARDLNRVSRYLQRLVEDEDLPPKLLAVHYFTAKNVRGRDKIEGREKVQVMLNFDGIGTRSGKTAGYEALSAGGPSVDPPLFNGFSLFYRLDTGVMRPNDVLGLTPETDYVMYQ